MINKIINKGKNRNLSDLILEEKQKGTSDFEIGRRYGVTYKQIERIITSSQGLNISSLKKSVKIKSLHPKDFRLEQTSVWSFKQRGNWATHSGEYRGNWSPYIPRNIILRYSKPGDLVLDYFCGAGTTAIECKLLGRRCTAIDINDKAIELARQKLDFDIYKRQLQFFEEIDNRETYEPDLITGDGRDLKFIDCDSVDLICSHPPYSDIIHYTNKKEGDLSFLGIDDFLQEMTKVAEESFRVLKPGGICAILIGDMRRNRNIIPLGFKLMNVYIKAGFQLRELIIKRQHNCKTTGFWYANSLKYNFLLLAHEYLPVFQKPAHTFFIQEEAHQEKPLEVSHVKPLIKKQIKELETSTVWIFPEEEFDALLDTNVIDRYWTSEGYTLINLCPSSTHSKLNDNKKRNNKRNSLIYIKAVPPDDDNFDINAHLEKVKKILESNIQTLNKNGIIAILTKDLRNNGLIEPIAKNLVGKISFDDIVLKEIVIIAKNKNREIVNSINEYLEIAHYYLLVYQKKK